MKNKQVDIMDISKEIEKLINNKASEIAVTQDHYAETLHHIIGSYATSLNRCIAHGNYLKQIGTDKSFTLEQIQNETEMNLYLSLIEDAITYNNICMNMLKSICNDVDDNTEKLLMNLINNIEKECEK